jgi:collagenase-like PrtC family protease
MLYLWPKERMEEFYRRVAESRADIVYLGESVCEKRCLSSFEDYYRWAMALREAGKQVVLSTLTLLESSFALKDVKRYCLNGEFLVEANDMAAIQILSEEHLPFVIGSAINCYNAHALEKLRKLGAVRWNMPVELSRHWLEQIKEEQSNLDLPSIETEVFSYGYIPLAHSGRCFTTRHLNRPKDKCQLVCQEYPQGIKVHSQEGQEIFNLNGIQTQSGTVYNLHSDRKSMAGLVDICRLSAHSNQCLEWIDRFKQGDSAPCAADSGCNGYWHNIAGMDYRYRE